MIILGHMGTIFMRRGGTVLIENGERVAGGRYPRSYCGLLISTLGSMVPVWRSCTTQKRTEPTGLIQRAEPTCSSYRNL